MVMKFREIPWRILLIKGPENNILTKPNMFIVLKCLQ